MLEMQDVNFQMIAATSHNIGMVYKNQKNTKEALHCFERALALREKIGDPVDIANSLNNIGAVYDEQGDWERGLKYYEQALQLREQIGNPIDIATSLNNIGLYHLNNSG